MLKNKIIIISLLSVMIIGYALYSTTGANDKLLASTKLEPLPTIEKLDQVTLGKLLYFEPRISADNTISCNSCHNVATPVSAGDMEATGTDNAPVSTGIVGRKGGRNSPTVWNAADRGALFWDGRAATLEEQAKGPMINPDEMGMPNHQEVINKLSKIPYYRNAFKKLYPHSQSHSGIDINNVAHAIAEFERTLIAKNSKFDEFRNGKTNVMNEQEIRGWKKFQEFACIACHGAPTFQTGHSTEHYIRFPAHRADEFDYLYKFTKDSGRFGVTGDPRDMNAWRVPSLRNVAVTAPYFHNGSVATLEQAVKIMGVAQLGRTFSDAEIQDLVAFLKTLTGNFPVIRQPELPKN